MIDNRVEAIKGRVAEIMGILGLEESESNRDTPLRIAKMYVNEVFAHRNDCGIGELGARMKDFPNEGGLRDPVEISVPFCSMCEHHWLPFMGTCRIAYVPGERILGLSKFPRVVKFFSRKPQLQERLTLEIGEYLVKACSPKSLSVEMEAEHTCVMCRGAESSCSTKTRFAFGEGG
jgi:GTP cyclohydrolase I